MGNDAAGRPTRHLVAAALGLVIGSGAPLACANAGGPQTDAAPAERPAPEAVWPTVGDEVLRAYGQLIAAQLARVGLDAEELSVLLEGVRAAARGDTLGPDDAALAAEAQAFHEARLEAVGRRRRQATQAFLDEAARAPGAERLESGLIFTRLEEGHGEPARTVDRAYVHFQGTFDDGTPYRSTKGQEEPAAFPVNNTMDCWKEALQRMRPGGRARLVCPSDLVYGDRGRPPLVPGGAALIVELELVGVDRVEDLVAEAEAREAERCGCGPGSGADAD